MLINWRSHRYVGGSRGIAIGCVLGVWVGVIEPEAPPTIEIATIHLRAVHHASLSLTATTAATRLTARHATSLRLEADNG